MKAISRILSLLPCRWSAGIILLTAAVSPCSGAAGVYMKLDGVEAWSVLTGASSDLKAATPEEPAVTSGLRLTKRPDQTSPLLLKACGTGAPVRRLTLAWRDAAGTVFRITLENVFVTSFSAQTDRATPPELLEECALRFTRVEWSWFGAEGAENAAGGTGVELDALTQQAAEKTYQPFRATVERRAGQQPGLRVTCPVERGRTYRLSASTGLDGQWVRLDEFTAAEDGVMERLLNEGAARLFLRVEALD